MGSQIVFALMGVGSLKNQLVKVSTIHEQLLYSMQTMIVYVVINCGELSDPTNGMVYTSPNTTYNSVATYGCDPGYMLTEDISHTCQANGSWSNTQPECMRK